MEKFKRKLKELEAESAYSQLKSLQAYKKEWARYALFGGACFVSITPLGGKNGFEAYIYGEAFDKFVNPALLQAMEYSINMKKSHTASIIKQIEIELEKTK